MFESVASMLVDTAAEVVGEHPAGLDDAELLAGVEELVALGRRVDAMAARLVSAAEARRSADVELGQRTTAWISHATRESARSARRRVRVARACRRLRLVADAWEAGWLSEDHVCVLARAVSNPRVADAVVGLQEVLIARAGDLPFEMWRTEVLRVVDRLDADGSHRPETPDAPSALYLLELFDGSVQLHAELAAADHAVVAAALNAEADSLFRRYGRDRDASGGEVELPTRGQLMAEALVALCRKGSACEVSSTVPLRPEVVVVVQQAEPDVATVGWGRTVMPISLLGGLLSDAAWRRVIIDPEGEVLDLGRTRRLANRAQRRALQVRDGGCVFPGCDAPVHWCDAHHLRPWEDGGRTDIRDLVLLCRHHHGVVHRNGWTWALDDDHRVRWTTPGGRVIVSQRHRQPPGATPIRIDRPGSRGSPGPHPPVPQVA